MLNLYDIMNQAQEGQVYAHLAQRFGLTEAQARAAVEALLPAFSAALKRSTDNPAGLADFLQALATGRYGAAFDNVDAAQSASAAQDGNLLGQLFGSPDVSRAVAAHAAAMSGLSAEVLKQMMPVLAATLMGGLARQAQTPGIQSLMEQMLRNMGLMGAMSRPSSGMPMNAWSQMMEGMMAAWLGRASGGSGAASGAAPTGRDLFGEMFEAGQTALRQQAAVYDKLLDNFVKGVKRD